MERTSKKNFIIDVLYAFLVIGIVIAVSYAVIKFLLPFVLGSLVAFCVQKPANIIAQKIKPSKGICAAILSFLLYLTVAAVVCFLIYRIILAAMGFANYSPQFFENITEKANLIGQKYSHVFERVPIEMRVWIKSLVSEASQKLVSSIGGWITDAVSFIIKKTPLFFVSGIVTLVATCYIAKDFDQLKKFVKSMLGNAVSERAVKIKNILVGSIFKMFKGYLILSFITFVQLYLGFLILRLEKPFVLAILIAVVDLFPVLGTGTVMIPWAFVVALTGNYGMATGLGIIYVITVIARNFLEPKIIGRQLDINALFTLLAMFLGLKILGILGLLLFPIIFIVTVQYYKDEMREGLSV